MAANSRSLKTAPEVASSFAQNLSLKWTDKMISDDKNFIFIFMDVHELTCTKWEESHINLQGVQKCGNRVIKSNLSQTNKPREYKKPSSRKLGYQRRDICFLKISAKLNKIIFE